jgi:formylglycine-generating enzyme required for sulfatase activity
MRRSWRGWSATLPVLASLGCAELAGIEAGTLADTGGATALGGSPPVGGGTAGASSITPEGGSGAEAGSLSQGGGSTAGSGGTPSAGGTSGGGTSAAAGTSSGPSCVDGTCSTCPEDMLRAVAGGIEFCIDAYEVTNLKYLAFVNAHDPSSLVPSAECAENTSFSPSADCDGGALTDLPSRNLPVVCVDYCDAEAYCQAQGKQLCGRIGGGQNPPEDAAEADASEWFAACSGESALEFPYGNTSDDDACNGSAFAPSHPGPKPAAELPSCEGGVPGLFNMSGNVAEWERSCSGQGSSMSCLVRGGGFSDGPFELGCEGSQSLARDAAANDVGIRCCAELPR